MFMYTRRFLPLVLIFALLLASCAQAGAPPAPPPPPAANAGNQQSAAPAAAAPAGLPNVPRNRTLIMAGLGGEQPGGFTDVELFNPYSPGLSRSGNYQACSEGLFYYNMIGDKFIPWIGESFKYNSDYTQATITLRKGVEWSDGTPYTANDVAFTLDMLLHHPDLQYAGEISDTVKSVKALDDLNVQIDLKSPDPRWVFDHMTFRADLGVPIVPEHVFKDKDPATFAYYDPAKGWPLCTGPYKLVATTVQQKIWDRRDDWWAAKIGFQQLPKVERLIFLPGMDENTMVQMSINNEIDMAFSFTAANMELARSQNPKLTTYSDKPPYGYMDWWPISLGFNDTVPPFDDPQIRWAISYSLNRDEIIQFAFKGTTTAIKLPYPDYPGLHPYIDSVSDLLKQYDTTEFNLSKAEAIMTGKGYTKDGDGFWVKDGKRITFQIITFPQHPSTTPQAPVVAEQLRKAGFDASFLLPADFVTRIQTGEAVAFLWGHGGSMRDPYTTLERLYHIKWFQPTGTAIPFTNLYRWSNKDFSDIVDQMTSVPPDDPKLKDLFHKAMEIWLPNLPDVMLTQTVILVPRNTTYWTNWPTPDNPYIHDGFWHRTALLLFMNVQPTQ